MKYGQNIHSQKAQAALVLIDSAAMTPRKYLFIAVLLSLSSCVHWSSGDTYRQAAVIAFQAADWRQTRRIATDTYPGTNVPCWIERNPILGEHPSAGQVDQYFAVFIAGNALISALLLPPYRAYWQYLSIGYEASSVSHNYQAGIRW